MFNEPVSFISLYNLYNKKATRSISIKSFMPNSINTGI